MNKSKIINGGFRVLMAGCLIHAGELLAAHDYLSTLIFIGMGAILYGLEAEVK